MTTADSLDRAAWSSLVAMASGVFPGTASRTAKRWSIDLPDYWHAVFVPAANGVGEWGGIA